MEYWEIDIWKFNEFNFLNEEVEEFISKWSQNLVNVRSPSYLKQNIFEYCALDIDRLYIPFFIWTGDVLLVWVKYMYMVKYIHVCIMFLMHDKLTMHKKWNFLLKISSVNVTKSAGKCGFGHIYWRNP